MSAPEEKNDRFSRALARFDEENSADPRTVATSKGVQATEVVYSGRVSERLARFAPGAPEALGLAVHAQHLCRWRLARTAFPEGRLGYLHWRRRCAEMHADLASTILREVGYEDALILEVARLLRKEGVGSEDAAQTLEDTACLVFFESYSEEFLATREMKSRDRILRRTWGKMSTRARTAAFELDLPASVRELVERLIESEEETA